MNLLLIIILLLILFGGGSLGLHAGMNPVTLILLIVLVLVFLVAADTIGEIEGDPSREIRQRKGPSLREGPFRIS